MQEKPKIKIIYVEFRTNHRRFGSFIWIIYYTILYIFIHKFLWIFLCSNNDVGGFPFMSGLRKHSKPRRLSSLLTMWRTGRRHGRSRGQWVAYLRGPNRLGWPCSLLGGSALRFCLWQVFGIPKYGRSRRTLAICGHPVKAYIQWCDCESRRASVTAPAITGW